MLRVAAMLAAVLLAMIGVGCFSKPEAPQLTGGGEAGVPGVPDDGKSMDAPADGIRGNGSDAAATSCTKTTIADFAGLGMQCPTPTFSPGVIGAGASISYNEVLQISVPGNVGESASCQTAAGYVGGFAVQLTDPPVVPVAAVAFRAHLQNGNSTVSLSVARSTQTVATASCPDASSNSVAVTFAAPYWLRIKGDGAPNETLDVGISMDGTNYITIKTCQLVGSAGSGTAELGASGGSGSADTMGFDNLESCP